MYDQCIMLLQVTTMSNNSQHKLSRTELNISNRWVPNKIIPGLGKTIKRLHWKWTIKICQSNFTLEGWTCQARLSKERLWTLPMMRSSQCLEGESSPLLKLGWVWLVWLMPGRWNSYLCFALSWFGLVPFGLDAAYNNIFPMHGR